MQNLFVAVTTLISASFLFGCSEKPSATSPPAATSSISNSAAAKSDARAATIKDLEARAAKSDPDAQLSLAKVLLDGSETPPNYERAKELLVSASEKGLPEAMWGLYWLRAWNVINDDRLPDASTLRAKALATQDPFLTLLTYLPSYFDPVEPPELVVKLATSGNPMAIAKMAKYYGQMAWGTDSCRKLSAGLKALKSAQSPKELERCLRLARVPDSYQRSIEYAEKILDAKEVDADKVRFWPLLYRRVAASQDTASKKSSLLQMQMDYVKADPYSSVIAEALTWPGKILKDGIGGPADPSQAAQFLKRAAELGNAQAQNALGELYQSGRGFPKDFEMAARYFGQSAQQGEAAGAKNIGLAFARGQGVERKPVQAYFWLSIGAFDEVSQSNAKWGTEALELIDDPAVLRDKLARSMKADEIAEAQRLTREWRPSYQVGPPPSIASLSGEASSTNGNTAPAGGVLTKKSTGTVFIVSAQGHAVTNHHVINGCTELRIEGREGIAKRVTDDAVNDLALIQTPGEAKSSAAITSEPGKLRQGEDIVAFGFPLNAVLSSGGNLTPGVVSALTGLGNNTNQIQITAPIQPGSSGSPVLNKKGEVVGVVSMKLSDTKMVKATGSVGQNVNFAVNGQTLKTFLDTHKVDYRNGGGLFSREKSTADLADEARKWTLVVECWK